MPDHGIEKNADVTISILIIELSINYRLCRLFSHKNVILKCGLCRKQPGNWLIKKVTQAVHVGQTVLALIIGIDLLCNIQGNWSSPRKPTLSSSISLS
jgi:hypothetical protein